MSPVLSGRRVSMAAEARTVGRPRATLDPADDSAPDSTIDLVLRSQEQEIVSLRKQLDSALLERERLRDAQPELEDSAYARGFDAGREAARNEFEDRQRDRLKLLSEGVANAVAAFESTLAELLAASERIACAGIEKILGEGAPQDDAVRRVIRQQLAELRDALPIRVRVSGADFDDLDPLLAEVRTGGAPAIEVICDPALPSGACRIELQLGEVEADVATQLAALRAVLIGGAGVER